MNLLVFLMYVAPAVSPPAVPITVTVLDQLKVGVKACVVVFEDAPNRKDRRELLRMTTDEKGVASGMLPSNLRVLVTAYVLLSGTCEVGERHPSVRVTPRRSDTCSGGPVDVTLFVRND